MSEVLEGAVQLDRLQPLRVMLDTAPVTQLSIEWRDVVGCWQMRVSVDPLARRTGVVVQVLATRYHGLFVRVPGEDAFWPSVELYGVAIASVGAIAQRDARAARKQITLALPEPVSGRGNAGTKFRRKGRK